MKHINTKIIRDAARILRCLGHAQRLRIVECLEQEELPVLELMRSLRLDQVTVSKHLAVLRSQGLVRSKGKGSYRYYSISDMKVLKVLHCVRQNGDDRK